MSKHNFRFLLLIFFLNSLIFGQVRESIHKIQYNFNKDYISNSLKFSKSSEKIIPLNKEVAKILNKSVFGYLPYW